MSTSAKVACPDAPQTSFEKENCFGTGKRPFPAGKQSAGVKDFFSNKSLLIHTNTELDFGTLDLR